MHDLTHAAHLTEADASNLIFDACRANEARANVTTKTRAGQAVSVTFTALPSGEHMARVIDENGFLIAAAWVDQFDR